MPYLGRADNCRIMSLNTTGESLNLNEHYLKLNRNEVGAGVDQEYSGIIVERGQLPDAYIRFNEHIKDWEYGIEGNMKLIGKKILSINSSSILLSSHIYFVDSTERPLTLLLPQFPKVGDAVSIIDVKGIFDVNMVTVSANSNRMMGTTENCFLDLKYTNVTFTFLDSDNGWIISPSNPITLSGVSIDDSIGLDPLVETKSSNFTIEPQVIYEVNTTSSPVSITLPINVRNGNWFSITDIHGAFDINNCIILFNGTHTILKNSGNFILDSKYATLKLIFNNNNWSMFS